MSYTIEISPKAEKFLDRQSDKTVIKINRAFSKLEENPYYSQELDIKKLAGCKGDYRLRIGQLRILYTVFRDKKQIYVYKIARRSGVYK